MQPTLSEITRETRDAKRAESIANAEKQRRESEALAQKESEERRAIARKLFCFVRGKGTAKDKAEVREYLSRLTEADAAALEDLATKALDASDAVANSSFIGEQLTRAREERDLLKNRQRYEKDVADKLIESVSAESLLATGSQAAIRRLGHRFPEMVEQEGGNLRLNGYEPAIAVDVEFSHFDRYLGGRAINHPDDIAFRALLDWRETTPKRAPRSVREVFDFCRETWPASFLRARIAVARTHHRPTKRIEEELQHASDRRPYPKEVQRIVDGMNGKKQAS